MGMADNEVLDREVADHPTDEIDETLQQDDDEGDKPEDEDQPHDGDTDGEGSETDEVDITIGDESPPSEEEQRDQRAPAWVGELRKSKREADRRNRELTAEVERLKGAGQQPQPVTVGPKPTLEACGYDEAKYEADLTSWHDRKAGAAAEEARKQEAASQADKAWKAQLAHHSKLKSELKVRDFDEAEANVEDALSVTQRGLIVHGAENSAQIVYALGRNPKTLKDLAAITDPVKFAFAVARLETKLKVTPRTTAPLPERQIRGNAPAQGSTDKRLERLEADAVKSGDRSKVIAYKRDLKTKRAG